MRSDHFPTAKRFSAIFVFRPMATRERSPPVNCLSGLLVRAIQGQEFPMTEQITPLRQRMIDEIGSRFVSAFYSDERHESLSGSDEREKDSAWSLAAIHAFGSRVW